MTDWADGIETRNFGIKSEIDVGMLAELTRTTIAFAIVAGALLFFSWVRSQIINTGYENQNLFAVEESLLRTQKRLILEEETLRNPERIDVIARSDLGMAPLRPGQLILPQLQDVEHSTSNVIAMAEPKSADSKDAAPTSAKATNPNN